MPRSRQAALKISVNDSQIGQIPEARRAEAALRESEEKVRTLAEHIPQLHLRWAEEGGPPVAAPGRKGSARV